MLTNNNKNYKKKLREQAKLFFQNSSLHGVKYVAENERSFIERFMWFIWIVIGLITTTIIILNLWDKFQTNPTITGLDTNFHNWEVAFPAITICQLKPTTAEKISDYLLKYYNKNTSDEAEIDYYIKLTQLSINTWREFTKYNNDLINTSVEIKDLVYNLSNKCDDIFTKCYWKSTLYNCCDIFYPVFTENGFCYTFNSKHYDRNLPKTKESAFMKHFIEETDLKWSLSFEVKSRESFYSVYISNVNDITSVDTKPQHIWDFRIETILFSVKQTYTTEDTSQLNMKQRRCAFQNDVKIQIDDVYSYSACTVECRMKNSMKYCSCIPFFYPSIPNSVYRYCKIDKIDCISKHLDDIMNIEDCKCHLGCLHTAYEIEKLNSDLSDQDEDVSTLEIKFVSWPMVRYKREVLFGWVDLLVSFGGIAGLFLGFSLLSAVEIIYYFTIRLYCVTLRKNDVKRSIKIKGLDFDVDVPISYNRNLRRRLSHITLSRFNEMKPN